MLQWKILNSSRLHNMYEMPYGGNGLKSLKLRLNNKTSFIIISI